VGSSRPKLTVVLPTYNEADNIPVVLERLSRSLSGVDYEVVVVDDDSPDGTWRVAERLAEERGYPVRVIRRVGERGLGTAIVRGLREARGDYVVVMDADLQHPPELVPKLYQKALETGADVVVASRYRPGGGVRGWSRHRLLISKAASLLAHLLLPESKRTSDPMSGFFLVRRTLAEQLQLEGRSWKVLLEILAKAPHARVEEVPYTFERRLRGESKLGLKAMLSYLLDLLRLASYRPVKFATVGATGTAVNLAILWLLGDRMGLPSPLPFLAAFEISLTWNYALHDMWTFRGVRPPGARSAIVYWLKYHAASLAGFATYTLTGWALHSLGLTYTLSGLAGILAGFTSNFLLSQHRVWNPTQSQRGREVREKRSGGKARGTVGV
jgi:dolichol-phosphate mannosyltransferase